MTSPIAQICKFGNVRKLPVHLFVGSRSCRYNKLLSNRIMATAPDCSKKRTAIFSASILKYVDHSALMSPNIDHITFAFQGKTTDVLKIKAERIDWSKFDAIFLLLGTNDCASTASNMTTAQICQRIKVSTG